MFVAVRSASFLCSLRRACFSALPGVAMLRAYEGRGVEERAYVCDGTYHVKCIGLGSKSCYGIHALP